MFGAAPAPAVPPEFLPGGGEVEDKGGGRGLPHRARVRGAALDAAEVPGRNSIDILENYSVTIGVV